MCANFVPSSSAKRRLVDVEELDLSDGDKKVVIMDLTADSPPPAHESGPITESFSSITVPSQDEEEELGSLPLRAPNSTRSKLLAEFYVFCKQFETKPVHDMIEILTSKLSSLRDLRDEEVEECLQRIRALSEKRSNEEKKEYMDDSSMRMVEMISGRVFTSESRERLRGLVRICLAALGSSAEDEAFLQKSYKDALNLLQIPMPYEDAPEEPIGFLKVARLLTHLPELRVASQPISDAQFTMLKQVFSDSLNGQSGLVLEDAFEILPDTASNAAFPRDKERSSALYFHCTKNAGNLAPILSQGLQVKGSGGRLGCAIYLADCMGKSLQYCAKSVLKDGKQYGVVFVVEAALGRTFETRRNLSNVPDGYDSVTALSSMQCQRTVQVPFADGTSCPLSYLPAGQTLSSLQTHLRGGGSSNSSSEFAHNEFTLYSPHRVRLRFMLLFSQGGGRGELSLRSSTPNLPASVSDFDAFQMDVQLRKRFLEAREAAIMQHGHNSKQARRATALLKELIANNALAMDFFKQLGRLSNE